MYDGHDDGKKTTGPKLSEAKESDSVQAMLLTLQAGWDQNVMARAKLRSRVGVLEHENMELKKQLEAALAEITDLQVARFDPSNVAFLVFMENVGDADSNGIDVDFQWAPTNNLTISGAASFLSTEITRLNDQLQGVAVPVGSDLPLAPDFSGNLRARYDFELPGMGANAYVTGSVTYRGESLAGIVGSASFMDDTAFLSSGSTSGLAMEAAGGNFGTVADSNGSLPANSRFINESATVLSASAGIMKDSWLAEVYVRNLTSERGAIVQTAGKFTPEASVNRPRTIGLRLSYRF